jgi:hypothetical protein
LCEPLLGRPAGAEPCDGVVAVEVVPLLLVVVGDELAALAIAAPPPSSAPLTASVASSGLGLIMSFTSFHRRTRSARFVAPA